MSPGDEVRFECTGHGVAELVLDRPQARNALSRAMTDAMAAFLAQAEEDPAVRIVLLRAEGAHFAAGADLKELVAMTAAEAEAMDLSGSCDALGRFAKPVVCAVQGVALGGGCELVEMCDVVIAADDAMFGHPEVRVGTMPGAGGTQRLPRIVGRTLALDLLLTGRPLTAEEALRSGLASRVVPRTALLATARSVAQQMAALPGDVQRMIKAAVRGAAELPLELGLRLERQLFHRSLAGPERTGAMQAFLARAGS